MALSQRYLLGIDLGGTYLRFILAEAKTGNINIFGRKSSKRTYLSPFCSNNREFVACKNNEKLYAYIVNKLENYFQEIGIKKRQVVGIGISVAGKIEEDNTCIGSNLQLKPIFRGSKYQKINFIPTLKRVFSSPIRIAIENDATAAGLVQAYYYQQKGFDPNKTFYVTISTGIGGGGPKRNLDEIGHILVDGYFPHLKPLCGCGSYGCLETFASGEGIKKQAMKILDIYFHHPSTFHQLNIFELIRTDKQYDLSQIIKKSQLVSLYQKQALTTERIFELANLDKRMKKTDQFAYYLVDTAADRLAKALVSIARIHNIERFGFGGSVIFNNPQYLELIKEKIAAHKFCKSVFPQQPVMEITPLGNYIADYGALFLVVSPRNKKQWLATISKLTTQKPLKI